MSILSINNLSKKYLQSNHFAVHHFSLDIQKGEIVAITGESGCGKTTLLRLIAGLEIPDEGSISIYNQIVANRHTWIKPEKRKIGMVFQDYALFPHLNVQENIGFGLDKKANKSQVINDVLALVGLKGYEKRYPHELSGGQQQRVALARAFAPQPAVLLLDEPFSNLDEMLKDQVREELYQIIRQLRMTTLLVTHDTKDALTIADKIAVMKHGELQQYSNPKHLYESPDNLYVAKFFGKINVFKGKRETDSLITPIGNFFIRNEKSQNIGIRPEQIDIEYFDGNNDKPNILKATITNLHFFGAYQEIIARINNDDIIIRTVKDTNWQEGQEVLLTINKYCEF
ncbi:MAG: ABC transporter ATP-binding protein [Flavobacterium sp.]|nr:ABC transporter ATP-binding protein [Flavobacterium sp.]MCU0394023.1 ABC transporter ATP-binding protein [Thermoflexibacter sp.]